MRIIEFVKSLNLITINLEIQQNFTHTYYKLLTLTLKIIENSTQKVIYNATAMWRSTSKWHVMPFRQLYLLSLLLIFCCTYCSAVDSAFSKGDSTCCKCFNANMNILIILVSSWRQIRSARVSLEEQCDSKLWQTGWRYYF